MNTLAETVRSISQGDTHSVALIEQARARADRHAALNPLAQPLWEAALAEAAQRDRQAAEGRIAGPLHGVPITIKDLFATRGATMRAGTRARLPDLGQDEAGAVRRLRDAGAIVVATTNMHEIALGATGENEWTGDVCNPFDPSRQAGGSSSGAAVSVAVGIGALGLGSDTGGSVRVPANLCGIVGFKPTFGAVPLDGALHLSWSCDHAGPLANCVADARLAFEVLAARSASAPARGAPPRFAVPESWLAARVAGPVSQAFEHALGLLRARGARIESVDSDSFEQAWTSYPTIVRAEAAWIHRAALEAGDPGFSKGVLDPLRLGQAVTKEAYFQALSEQRGITRELQALLAGFDALLLPTAAILPPPRGPLEADSPSGPQLVRKLVLGQTLAFNMSGQPALTLPMGMAQDLPIGLQMVGSRGADAELLALGEWVEGQLRAATAPLSQRRATFL